MTEVSDIEIPPPKDWQCFERWTCDLLTAEWQTVAIMHGRAGQPQNGVDIYAQAKGSKNWYGVQCKKKDQLAGFNITADELRREAKKAQKFTPPLTRFFIATTGSRDTAIQKIARDLSKEYQEKGFFSIDVMFWDDFLAMYDRHQEIFNQHYGKLLSQIDNNTNVIQNFRSSRDRKTLTRIEVVDFGCWATLGGYLAGLLALDPEHGIAVKAIKHLNDVIYKLNIDGIKPLAPDSIDQMQEITVKITNHLKESFTELSEWNAISSIIAYQFISQSLSDLSKLSPEEARQVHPGVFQNNFKEKLINLGIPIDEVKKAIGELSRIKTSNGYKSNWDALWDTLDVVR